VRNEVHEILDLNARQRRRAAKSEQPLQDLGNLRMLRYTPAKCVMVGPECGRLVAEK
jgi:hypothetical protein